MYPVIYQEEHQIEIALTDELTADEFKQVIHQLESLCTTFGNIYVMFDATGLNAYSFKMILDEYDFYKEYKDHLMRVAIVSDNRFYNFMISIFNKFSETKFKFFQSNTIEDARKWIFPSRLP